jgi:hypothetical protein
MAAAVGHYRNPVERLWEHHKDKEPDKLTCLHREDLHELFYRALNRGRGKPRLFPSFFAGSELPL